MQASADTDEAQRAALAAGNAHVKEHRWAGGWLVRTRQAPIVQSSEISMSDYSHGAWKRELGLTNVAGQSLPGYLFGGNALELVHEASGVRISFCVHLCIPVSTMTNTKYCLHDAVPGRVPCDLPHPYVTHLFSVP